MTTPTRIKRFRNGRVVNVKPTDLDRDRVRFNHGYWDAVNEWAEDNGAEGFRVRNFGIYWRDSHFDPVYVDGYNHGQRAAANGTVGNASDAAWAESGRMDGFSPVRLPKRD